jgi:hypothetical protein
MQRLLVVLLFGFALSAQAQNNVPEPNNNGELNNKSFNYNSNNGALSPENSITTDSVRTGTPVTLESKKPQGAKHKKSVAVERAEPEENGKKDSEELDELNKNESVDTPAAQTVQMQQLFQSNQASSSRQYSRRSASEYEQMNMDNSVQYYKAMLPDAFETHFFAYLAGHYNTDLYPELQAAAELKPEDTEVKKQLAAYHIINNDAQQAVPIIQELIDTGAVSSWKLLYANDLLVSGEPNSVIVLHGFDDMFATYFVQNNNAVRQDVQLLSLDFMQSATYRTNWTDGDLNLPESTVIDTAYLSELCRLNPEKPMQLSMTIPKDYFVGLRAKLYPVGLTFRYSEQPVDNFQRNDALWSTEMNKDLVDPIKIVSTAYRPPDGWYANYLPMLLVLRQQYIALDRTEDVKRIDSEIDIIARNTNRPDLIKKYKK